MPRGNLAWELLDVCLGGVVKFYAKISACWRACGRVMARGMGGKCKKIARRTARRAPRPGFQSLLLRPMASLLRNSDDGFALCTLCAPPSPWIRSRRAMSAVKLRSVGNSSPEIADIRGGLDPWHTLPSLTAYLIWYLQLVIREDFSPLVVFPPKGEEPRAP